jgi:hypothetical protein
MLTPLEHGVSSAMGLRLVAAAAASLTPAYTRRDSSYWDRQNC